jgi:acetoin utilization deacetylase AcuC-like enzyme
MLFGYSSASTFFAVGWIALAPVVIALKPLVISSEKLASHSRRIFHPECPERVLECIDMVKNDLVSGDFVEYTLPSGEEDAAKFDFALEVIKKVHDEDFVEEVKTMCARGAPILSPWDEDTYINRESFNQCVLAQSAWIDATNHALVAKDMGFALTRPPGHHSSKRKSMGFCIFNYAVGAATYALQYKGLKRVAILDFDVHFGNGISDLVCENPNIRYTSLHQEGIFPYRGKVEEVGPIGNIRNVPLPGGTKWDTYEPALVEKAIPFLKEFDPELVIVSAGYGALSQKLTYTKDNCL